MELTPLGSFVRALKRLSDEDRAAVKAALRQFTINPRYAALNFEPVRSRDGYFTIRATRGVRILLRRLSSDSYELVVVGNHDFVYASYFKK